MFARDFESEAMRETLLTHISIESSLKEEFVVFRTNLLLGPVEKVMIDLR